MVPFISILAIDVYISLNDKRTSPKYSLLSGDSRKSKVFIACSIN